MPPVSFIRPIALLAALLPAVAAASQPCSLPQVRMSPPTNTTGASAPIVVSVSSSATLPGPLETLVTVRDGTGAAVDATILFLDGGYQPAVSISGLDAPGWYTIDVAVSPAGKESADSSLWPTADGFEGEVLVGASAPSIGMITRCAGAQVGSPPVVIIRWSEPVVFDSDPASALTLRSDQGPLSCGVALPSSFDGGSVLSTFVRLDCPDAGHVESIRLVAPPRSVDGGLASFPPPGVEWATTGWTSDDAYALAYGCQTWQPSVHRATHENLAPGGLSPSYSKCDQGTGCGCAAGGELAAALVLLPLAAWVRRRAR